MDAPEPTNEKERLNQMIEACEDVGDTAQAASLRKLLDRPTPTATTPKEPPIRTTARYYTSQGWHVFKVDDQKRPRTARGFKDANLDAEQFNSGDRIAISTGAVSGLVVVDLDEKNDKHGIEEFKKLMGGHPEIITRTVKTPTGGAHLYFKHSGNLKTRIDHPSPGIDFKADGGYIVAPPSIMKDGTSYTVVTDCEPAELPDWLIEVMIAPAREEPDEPAEKNATGTPDTTSTTGKKYKPFKAPGTITAGKRNDTLYKTAVSLAGRGLADVAVLSAIKAENAAKCKPPLEADELQTIVNSAIAFNRASPASTPAGATPTKPAKQAKLIIPTPDPETRKKAHEIYTAGGFIDLCKENFGKVWLGDLHILEGVLFTAGNMRVLNAKDGLHIHVSGSTQTGKSDSVKAALQFIHPADQQTKTFSPMYLFHASKSGDLHERMIVFTDDTILDPEIAALYRGMLTSWQTGSVRGTVIQNQAQDLNIPARVSLILSSLDSVVSQSDEAQDESRFLTLEVKRSPEQMAAIRQFIQGDRPDIKKVRGLICAVWDLITPREVKLHKVIEKDLPIREFKRFLTLCQAHALLQNRTETTDADFDAIEKFLTNSRPMINSTTAAFTRKEAVVIQVLSVNAMTVNEIVTATRLSLLDVYRAMRGTRGTFATPTGGLMQKEPRLEHSEERSETQNNIHLFRLKDGGKWQK